MLKMTSVQVEKLLKKYLDELNEDQLKEFQWFLSLTERKEYRPIPKSQLKKATREEIVDKLVQVYGENGAVETTVDALKEMHLYDPAEKLNQANKKRNMEKRSLRVSSTARENQLDVDGTVPQHVSCSRCSVLTEPVMLQCDQMSSRTCAHDNWKQNIPYKSSFCCQVQHNSKPPMKALVTNHRKRDRAESSTGCRDDSESDQIPPKKIKEKREAFEKVREFCASSIEQVKSQSCDTQRKIKDDFEKLHAFLDTEEETRLAALKQEETQNIRRMELITEISRKTFSLSDDVKELEECGADDSFIQNFRTQLERTQNALSDPQKLPQAQINESEHVENLQHKVREKMLNSKTHTTEVLDPSAVYTRLPPSDGVTFKDLWQQSPGNSEHNTTSCPLRLRGNYLVEETEEDFYAEEETNDKESSGKH